MKTSTAILFYSAFGFTLFTLSPHMLFGQETVDVVVDGQKITLPRRVVNEALFSKGKINRKAVRAGRAAAPAAAAARGPAATEATPRAAPATFPSGVGRRAKVVPVDPVPSRGMALDERLPAITAAEAAAITGSPFLGGFRLRAAWDPVKLFKFDDATQIWSEDESAENSDGAEFGWINDRRANTRTWNAKGVAYLPYVFHATPTSQFLLIPSIEFNRDTATDGTPGEINSLIPRLGIDFNFVNHLDENPRGYIVRTSVGYQTDFEFDSGQWLFDLQYEPVSRAAGVGVFAAQEVKDRTVSLPGVRHKFTFAPILSFGSIEDTGGKISLADLKDTYVTLGGKAGVDLELNFLPNPINTTKLGVEYRWWTTLGSEQNTYDYLDAHLVVPLNGENMALKAFYRRGDTPATLEKVDILGLALTAKF